MGLIPSEGQAQIGVGFYNLHVSDMRDTSLEHRDEVWRPALSTRGGELIGRIAVPLRAPQGTPYLEHWSLFAGEKLLNPGKMLEIVPIDAVGSAEPTPVRLANRTSAWSAWSEEEAMDASASVAELLHWPGRPDLSGEIASIIQCHDCAVSARTDETRAVGWVLEWTDRSGASVLQEWWLTDEYVYPDASLPVRTFLRTLDERERTLPTRQAIVKRIVVEMVPADLAAPVGIGVEREAWEEVAGNCSSAPSRGGSSAILIAGLVLGLVTRRRRRPGRS